MLSILASVSIKIEHYHPIARQPDKMPQRLRTPVAQHESCIGSALS